MYSPSQIVLHKKYKAINHIQISICMKMNQEAASVLVLMCFYISVGCVYTYFKQNNRKFILKQACVLNQRHSVFHGYLLSFILFLLVIMISLNTRHISDSSVRLVTSLQAGRPRNQILILDRIKEYILNTTVYVSTTYLLKHRLHVSTQHQVILRPVADKSQVLCVYWDPNIFDSLKNT